MSVAHARRSSRAEGPCAAGSPDPTPTRLCIHHLGSPLSFLISWNLFLFSQMYSRVRPILSAARPSLSRIMSSLAPGNILQGAHWNYRVVNPVKGDNTHTSSVFKAEVLSRLNARNAPGAPQWFVMFYSLPRPLRLNMLSRALIKVASPSDAASTENMNRETRTYHLPGVASTHCFRKMYDVIDNSTVALEWLDTTLAEVEYQPTMHTYFLLMSVLRAALTSCVVLESHGYVNTG